MNAENRPIGTANLPIKLNAALTEVIQRSTQTRKEEKGNVLSLDDAETQLANSGPSGWKRLAAMRALDLQEVCPQISDELANQMGAGYVILRHLGRQGLLTESTRAENARLDAMRNRSHDITFEAEDCNLDYSKLEGLVVTDMYGDPLADRCIDESVSPKQMDNLERLSGERDLE